jgi:hypothetical protein
MDFGFNQFGVNLPAADRQGQIPDDSPPEQIIRCYDAQKAGNIRDEPP